MAPDENQRSRPKGQPSTRTPPRRRDRATPEALVTDGFVLPALEAPADAPPAYGTHHDQLQFKRNGFDAEAAVTGAYLACHLSSSSCRIVLRMRGSSSYSCFLLLR